MATTTPRSDEITTGERGYSWLSFVAERAWILRVIAMLLVIVCAIAFNSWYLHFGTDAAPDSIVGYSYAILGTIFLLLAMLLYSKRRRLSKKRASGQLHKALNWHVCFAILGLTFLFLHSFGNFNPRSGTYALYGLVALALSGAIGRFLDRLLPRLIAGEVHKALNAQGNDRIEVISQKIQSIVVHNTEVLQPHPLTPLPTEDPSPDLPHSPWDLAFISLEATPQELSTNATQYRFVPDKKSALTLPGALMPGTQQQIAALQDVQHALQREQLYRYMIRYWRIFHITLSLVTLGLLLWHIIYAMQLLLPTLLHR